MKPRFVACGDREDDSFRFVCRGSYCRNMISGQCLYRVLLHGLHVCLPSALADVF